MRFEFLRRIHNITVFAMIASTQTLEGVTSLQSDGKHYVLFDLDNCSLEQAEGSSGFVQQRYSLPDIFIVSDCENSFRGWCFGKVDFITYLKILLDTKYLDWNFLWWTFQRGKATLRISDKKGRPPQELVGLLLSYPVPFPSDDCIYEWVFYDTGFHKRAFSFFRRWINFGF
jgi:hypothetical protein